MGDPPNLAKRDEILMRVSKIKRKKSLPIGKISQDRITAIANALKSRFKDPNSDFGKDYLKFLVSEIGIKKKQLVVRVVNEHWLKLFLV